MLNRVRNLWVGCALLLAAMPGYWAGVSLRAETTAVVVDESAGAAVAKSDRSIDDLAAEFGLPPAQVETLLKIIEEGKDRSQVMQHLQHLCLEIGPRLTGSTRLETANRWTATQF